MSQEGSLRRVCLRHIDAIKQMAMGKKPQALVKLPQNTTIRKVYDKLVFSGVRDLGPEGFCFFLNGPGTFSLDDLGCTISLEEMEGVEESVIKSSKWTAYLNAEPVTYPLMIRNFRKGDRFIPFGMKGQKKVKDFFIDLKLPSAIRARIPILVCQNKLIWVCGLRIDDRFKVTRDVEKVLRVSFDTPVWPFSPV
jgi:tRNA(Ile)-lysidine synthase